MFSCKLWKLPQYWRKSWILVVGGLIIRKSPPFWQYIFFFFWWGGFPPLYNDRFRRGGGEIPPSKVLNWGRGWEFPPGGEFSSMSLFGLEKRVDSYLVIPGGYLVLPYKSINFRRLCLNFGRRYLFHFRNTNHSWKMYKWAKRQPANETSPFIKLLIQRIVDASSLCWHKMVPIKCGSEWDISRKWCSIVKPAIETLINCIGNLYHPNTTWVPKQNIIMSTLVNNHARKECLDY